MKFYKCKHCGNIIEMVSDKGVNPSCCGEAMEELVPGSIDAALEKHIPVIEEKNDSVIVKVGSIAHPMLPEHYIEWIVIHTDQGVQRKHLKPGDAPVAEFKLLDNEILFSAYAYCNLHGLWKQISE